MARGAQAVAFLTLAALLTHHVAVAGVPISINKGQGMGVPATGVSLTNLLSRAFKPSFSQPPLEVAVPTIQWQPVTVMTPTVQVYKMGFCVPRTQYSVQPADPVDCPPQTYMQQQNGQTVCARTDCAGPVGKAVQPAAEQQKTTFLGNIYFALQKSMPQTWGGTQAAICSTIFVKPIMQCPQNCISDARQGQDQCLCDAGLMGCPFNYASCGCTDFTLCVADTYFCDYYCKYAPSWYFAMVAKGDKACPIDPNQIDPLDPDPINPGFATPNGPTAIGRRLKSLA